MRREEWLNDDIKKFSKKQGYKKMKSFLCEPLRPPRLVCFFMCVAWFGCGRRLLQENLWLIVSKHLLSQDVSHLEMDPGPRWKTRFRDDLICGVKSCSYPNLQQLAALR